MCPTLHLVLQVAEYALLLFIITSGGNVFCARLLELSHQLPSVPQISGPPSSPAPAPAPASSIAVTSPPNPHSTNLAAGRYIGNLERLIIMIGLIIGSWDVLAVVIALKTVARYQELDKKIQAEYFLVGSMGSILWAIVMTSGLIWYDHASGMRVVEVLRSLFSSGKPQ